MERPIRVKPRGGVVTLTGTVAEDSHKKLATLSREAANRLEKCLVSKLARDFNGVKRVNDNMAVKVQVPESIDRPLRSARCNRSGSSKTNRVKRIE